MDRDLNLLYTSYLNLQIGYCRLNSEARRIDSADNCIDYNSLTIRIVVLYCNVDCYIALGTNIKL